MNFLSKFDSAGSDHGLAPIHNGSVPLLSEAVPVHNDAAVVPDAHLLFSGNYQRVNSDLVVSDATHHVVIHDYFRGEKRPTLLSPEGAPLDPKFIEAMTGHTAFAQAGPAAAAKVIAHVVKITGSASAVRNGVTVELNVGDNLLQGDVVQTGSGSALGLVLDDGTAFNMTANARLQLNSLVYDANSTNNSSLITLVQGAANFVAGQVAKTGDMKVATPVATLGIRGTAVTLDINSTDGQVKISVIDQGDNTLHAVQVFDRSGTLIGTVTSNGNALTLTPAANFQVLSAETGKSPADLQTEFTAFQGLISTYDAGKQLVPTLPQRTENNNNDNKSNDAKPGATEHAGSTVQPPGPPQFTLAPSNLTNSAAADKSATQATGTTVAQVVDQALTNNKSTSTTTIDTNTPAVPTFVPVTETVKPAPAPVPFVVNQTQITAISAGHGDSFGPVMSADGRFIVYDPPGDIFLYDRQTGVTTTIQSAGSGITYSNPTISSDGRTIVFQGVTSDGQATAVLYNNDPTSASYQHTTQLHAGTSPAVSGDGGVVALEEGGTSIGLFDQAGHQIAEITPATAGVSSGTVWKPAISADGHSVAFWATPQGSAGGAGTLYLYNSVTGAISTVATTATGAGNVPASLSADGRFVTYQSDSSGTTEIFLYDHNANNGAGGVVFSTVGVAGSSHTPVISPDGHFIIFASDAKLTSSDTNSFTDTYVVDVTNPGNPVYKLVSGLSDGTSGNAASDGGGAISTGGLFVAFGSSATNLVTGSTGPAILAVDASQGRSGLIQENAHSPSVLTSAGVIPVTGLTSDQTISFTQPAIGSFTATLDTANNVIRWTYTVNKSDVAFLNPGDVSNQTSTISLKNAGGTLAIPVAIAILDTDQTSVAVVDHAPTDILLSNNSVVEHSANGTIVGKLSAIDPDIADSASFTLIDNAGGKVALVGKNLVVAGSLDAHDTTSLQVTVQATDLGGLSVTKTLTLAVTPAGNTAPTVTSASLSVSEGGTVVLTAGNIGVTDPDSTSFAFKISNVTHGNFQTSADGVTWTNATAFSSSDLAASHVRFVHDGGEIAPTFSIQANDGASINNLSNTLTGSVNFTNVNDAPTIAAGTTTTGTVTAIAQVQGQPQSGATSTGVGDLMTGSSLVKGLGGTSGFGENTLALGDDNSSNAVDITSVFGPNGVNFFGHNYTSIFINNNGNITFNSLTGTFTPSVIDAGTNNPIIAAFWADVDTRGGAGATTPGGNSDGADKVFYDLDPVSGVLTITWDDVGYFSSQTDKQNAFQIQLVNEGDGNFDIVYRYENINWTTGSASGGADGLGGTPARAGYSAGDGIHYFELPQSGNQSALLALPTTAGNTGIAGVDVFNVRNGAVSPASSLATTGVINFSDPDVNDTHTIQSVTYLGSDTALGSLNLSKTADTTGSGLGGSFAWTYTVSNNDAAFLAAGQTRTESFLVTISDGHGGTVSQRVDVTINGVDDGPAASSVHLADSFANATTTIRAADLLAGVTDVDTPAAGLSISSVSVASGGGTITDNHDGTWTYAPAANYSGGVVFNYVATDGTFTAASTASLNLTLLNVISGDAGNNTLTGTNGNDAFEGFGGNDTINGLAGRDKAIYVDAVAGITVHLAAGTVQGTASGDVAGIGTDTLRSIEYVWGSNFDDTFDATGFNENSTNASSVPSVGKFSGSITNFFEGGGGNDTIIGNGATQIVYDHAAAAVFVDLAAGTAHGVASGDVAQVGTDTFSGVTGVRGSAFNDTLLGNNDARGVDVFYGGAGDDTIDGRAGYDLVIYQPLVDNNVTGPINVNLAAGTVTGDNSIGTDTLRSVEAIRGTNFADTINAVGFSGSSTNAGSFGTFNQIEGMGGNDTITGNGFTTVDYTDASAGVTVDIAAGTSHGTDANDVAQVGTDTFTGVNGIRGSEFDDVLLGSNNPSGTTENFTGGGGNDFIDGRGGFDRAIYSSNNGDRGTAGIHVDMGAGTVVADDASSATSTVGTDTLRSIEAIRGTDFADTYDATGYSATSANAGSFGFGLFNEFEGMGGNDTVLGNGDTRIAYYNALAGVTVNLATGTSFSTAPNDAANVGVDTFSGVNSVAGSAFGDTLIGNSGANIFNGGGGDDTIDGGGGTDVALFTGPRSDYTITTNPTTGQTTVVDSVANRDGTDTLTNVEAAQFSDGFYLLSSGSLANPINLPALQPGVAINPVFSLTGNANDFVLLSSNTGGLAINLGAGTGDTVVLSGGGNALNLINVENVIGSAGDDNISLSRNANGLNVDLKGGTNTIQLTSGANSLSVTNVSALSTSDFGAAVPVNDTLTLLNNVTGLSVNLGNGANTLNLAAGANTLTSVFLQTINGSTSDDSLTITSNTANLGIDLGGGDDTVTLTAGTGFFSSLALNNVEHLRGSTGDDTIALTNNVNGLDVDLGGGNDMLTLANGTNSIKVANVERIVSSDAGSNPSSNDVLTLLNNVSGTSVDLFKGINTLNLAAGANSFTSISDVAVINGTASADTLTIDQAPNAAGVLTRVDLSAGNDTLSLGSQTFGIAFVEANGGGADVLNGFNRVREDKIDLSGVAGFHSLSDVQAHAQSINNGADTLITFSAGNTLTLTGVQLNSLQSSDFLFSAGPVFDLDSGSAGNDVVLSFTEHDPTTRIAPSGVFTDAEVTSFDGVKLIVTLTAGGSNGDVLNLANQGTAAGQISFSGNTLKYGNVTIGTYDHAGFSAGGNLQVTFNSSATPAAIQAVASAVTFSNDTSNTASAQRDVQYHLTGANVDLSANGTINIHWINDAPFFTGLDNSASFVVGGSAVVLDNNATVFDADLNQLFNYSGSTLALQRHGGANGDDVFGTSGNVSLTNGHVLVSGTDIGTYTNNNGSLVIAFGANALGSGVNTVLQNLTYSNGGSASSSVQVDYVFSDGNNGQPGTLNQGTGGVLTATGSISVAVTAPNHTPVIDQSPQTASVAAAGTSFVTGQFTATDPDAGDTKTWTVDGGTRLEPVNYNFAIDEFKVTKGSTTLFDDTFTGTSPPTTPTAGSTANPNSLTYSAFPDTSSFANQNGEALLTSGNAEIVGLSLTNGSPTFGQFATLLTDNTPGGTGGLRANNNFVTEGKFDLVTPPAGTAFGIRLADRASFGTSAQPGSGVVELAVVNSGGSAALQLSALDFTTDTFTVLQTVALTNFVAGDEIALDLSHQVNDPTHLTASYAIIHNGVSGSSQTLAVHPAVFGSDDWLRAQFFGRSNAVTSTAPSADSAFKGTYGTLDVDQNGHWAYQLDSGSAATHALAAGQTAHDVFTVRVADGANASSTQTVDIVVTGSNDAPVLQASAPTLTSINNTNVADAGHTVASIIGTSITDVDANSAKGIAITAASGQDGAWQYSIDNGAHWLDVNASAAPASASSALLLDSSDLVRFVPNGTSSGGADTLSFVAWDESTGTHGQHADASVGGGTTAFSTQSDLASIAVTPAVQAPSLDLNGSAAGANYSTTIMAGGPAIALLAPGATITHAATLQSAHISLVGDGYNGNTDYPNDFLTIDTTTLADATYDPDTGVHSWNGLSWSSTNGPSGLTIDISGSGSTTDYLQLLEAARAQFTADTHNTGATVSVTVNDGTQDSAPATTTIALHVNEAPSIDGGSTETDFQANGAPVFVAANVSVSDSDSANFAGGKLIVDISAGLHDGDVVLVHNGDGSVAGDISISDGFVYYHVDENTPQIEIGTTDNASTDNHLIIDLNENANDTTVAALVQAIQFQNNTSTPTNDTRTLQFTLEDGGGTGGGGNDAASFSVDVAVDSGSSSGSAINWTGGGDDNEFLTAANWDTGVVPGSDDDAVINAFTSVVLDVAVPGSNYSVNNLTVAASNSLTVQGDFDNPNTPTSGFSVDSELDNSGMINVTHATLDLGLIVVNAGGVIDAQNDSVVFIGGSDVDNRGGTLRAEATGLITIEHSTVTGGTISATGNSTQSASVLLLGSTLVGGEISTSNFGSIDAVNASDIGTVFDGSSVDMGGSRIPFTIDGGAVVNVHEESTLTLQGEIDNSGQINLFSGLPSAVLQIVGDTTIAGDSTGTIVLQSGSSIASDGSGNLALLDNNNNTISGSGTIGDENLTLINGAFGIIEANGFSDFLGLDGASMINHGTIAAIDGGSVSILRDITNDGTISVHSSNPDHVSTVLLDNAVVTNTGTLQAGGGGHIDLFNAAIAHGHLSGINDDFGAGLIETVLGPNGETSTNFLDGSELANAPDDGAITIDGELRINERTTLEITGTIHNNGEILVDGLASGGTLAIDGNVQLDSAPGQIGTVTLDGVADQIASANGPNGGDFFENVDNTISGFGNIGDGVLGIQNDAFGTIAATDATNKLTVNVGVGTFTNHGLVASQSTGGLEVTGAIDNDGTLSSTLGLLKIDGAATGGGAAVLDGGSIEFASASDQAVQFAATSQDVLILDDAADFTGTISGFSNGDTITLHNLSGTPSIENVSGDLRLFYAPGQSISLGQATGVAPDNFEVHADNSGNATITFHQAVNTFDLGIDSNLISVSGGLPDTNNTDNRGSTVTGVSTDGVNFVSVAPGSTNAQDGNGTTVHGTYVDLLVGSDGTNSLIIRDNPNNAALISIIEANKVQTTPLSDTFYYQVHDSIGTHIDQVTWNLDDLTFNGHVGPVTAPNGETVAINDITVHDGGPNDIVTVNLSLLHDAGMLALDSSASGATLDTAHSDATHLAFSGTADDINADLSHLTYTATQSNGSDVILISGADGPVATALYGAVDIHPTLSVDYPAPVATDDTIIASSAAFQGNALTFDDALLLQNDVTIDNGPASIIDFGSAPGQHGELSHATVTSTSYTLDGNSNLPAFGSTLVDSAQYDVMDDDGLRSNAPGAIHFSVVGANVIGATELDSTSANDILIGGAGSDNFVFAPNSGNDTVVNFTTASANPNAHDIIDLAAFGTHASDFQTWLNTHATTSGSDTLIHLDDSTNQANTVLLKGIAMQSLQGSDFHFAPLA